MINIPSFIKTGPSVQNLLGGGDRQKYDLIGVLLFFQNNESRQKKLFRTHKKECIKTWAY
jgi:hypothetical protein